MQLKKKQWTVDLHNNFLSWYLRQKTGSHVEMKTKHFVFAREAHSQYYSSPTQYIILNESNERNEWLYFYSLENMISMDEFKFLSVTWLLMVTFCWLSKFTFTYSMVFLWGPSNLDPRFYSKFYRGILYWLVHSCPRNLMCKSTKVAFRSSLLFSTLWHVFIWIVLRWSSIWKWKITTKRENGNCHNVPITN